MTVPTIPSPSTSGLNKEDPGFKSADKITVELWEKQDNKIITDLLRIFDFACSRSMELGDKIESIDVGNQNRYIKITFTSADKKESPFKHVESTSNTNTGQPISQGITRDSLRAALKAAGVPDAGVAIELVDGRLTAKSGKLDPNQFNAFKDTVKAQGLRWDSVNKAWYAEVSL